jgi:hypothetical protein
MILPKSISLQTKLGFKDNIRQYYDFRVLL